MKHQRSFVLALLSVLLFGSLASVSAQAAEKRLGLVVGNANYSSGALPTPANDAGLIAQTLQAAGFDVVGVRDLDQDSLRRTFRDFIAKVSAAGPDTKAFIYPSDKKPEKKEEHTPELQAPPHLPCPPFLLKKKKKTNPQTSTQ